MRLAILGFIGLLSFSSRNLPAQALSVGVKGGVPLTDAVEGSFGNRSEARYSTIDTAFGITSITRVRANSWEFPLLVKYYLPSLGVSLRPFVEAGYVVRHLTGVEASAHTFGRDTIAGIPINQTIPLNTSFLVRDDPTHGFAAGGGVRLRFGRLRIAPEVRYTRWTGRGFEEQGSRGFFVQSVQNQADFLVGLSF
jgi:hypothetical protein